MSHRILIVEDNKTLANLMGKKINIDLEWEVDIAYSLSEAKLFLHRYKYFVVLSDLNLPDAPNGEIVDYLLSKDQKVIVLSGNIDNNFRKEMMKKNIIDYVKKSGANDIKYIITMLQRLAKNQEHTVLVVDDSMVIRNNLKSLLENLFFKVITVAHGEEAVMMLQTNLNISLVITDYNMPVMDGLELTKEIRKTHDKNELSIVALSSNDDEEVVALFLKNGANDYIKKPFSKEEFYCRIDNTIEALENVRTILNSANRDFLTGIYNRRYFFNHIQEYIDMSKESFKKLYIAMLDIDHFKKINDTYGHDEGDKAIVAVADILRTNTHQEDLVARFGGEEFCVAMLAENDEMAYNICERIRQKIESFSFLTKEDEEVSFTISVGLAEHGEDDDINDTINEADLRLYEAKNSGRNKVVFQ
ncbi:MAG: diguanylate cyclase [Epsilonproteobacteria bacterium]|nr:diguanylate cyclase [Campylobacterota bacterium]